MTLQELKDKKNVFSNISDEELIQIFNKVLSLKPEINSMNHDLSKKSIDRVLYSNVYIDWFINKVKSYHAFSKTHQCDEILKNLRVFLARASLLEGFGKEIAYINQKIMRYERERTLYIQMDASLDRNMDVLIDLDPKDVVKLNKEALALYAYTTLEKINQNVDEIKNSQDDVKNITSENERLKAENGKQQEELARLEAENKKQQEEIARLQEELNKKNKDEEVHEDVNDSGMQPLVTGDKIVEPKKIESVPHVMQPLYPWDSLRDLKNTYNIFKNISDEELIDYCNNVLNFEPKIVDMKTVLTKSQIELLSNSNLVSNAEIKKTLSGSHDDVLKNYSSLISNYENMLKGMQGKKEFEREFQKITEVVTTLKGEMDAYSKMVASIGNQDVNKHLDFTVSKNKEISRRVSEISKGIVDDQQEKLTEIDSTISDLTSSKKSLEAVDAKFFTTKIKKGFDVRVLDARIKHLKKKQGRMQSSQKMIVYLNSELYIHKMQREFKKYAREQEKLAYAISTKESKIKEIKDKERKLQNLSLKIKDVQVVKEQKQGVAKTYNAKKEKLMKNKEDRLQRSIKRLQNKSGNVNLAEQYQTTLDNKISYAL